MNELDIHLQSWIGNAIGAFVFLSPLLILLYLLKKDEDISKKYRIIAKFFFGFLLLSYLAGGMGKAIALNS